MPWTRVAARLLAACLGLAAAALPAASEDIEALRAEIEAETKCYVSPGPEDAGPRAICVWRPSTAGSELLPTLYMVDGMMGIYVAALPLKRAMEAGTVSPMMIIGLDPRADPEERAEEYVRHFHGSKTYVAHDKWFVDYVIPWAERMRKAAPGPENRYIGGFSNGADWAVTTAGEHSDLFAGVLVHSPMMTKTKTAQFWTEAGAANLRWVVTGGTEEVSGTIKPKAALPKKLVRVLTASGAPVRSCIGKWEHELRAWRKVSGGSIAWMAQLGDPAVVQGEEEVRTCETPA